jgi:two-component system, chemotaxis family, chemotaxis protein CheY
MINVILIVDDSPISRKMLKSCIPKDRGYVFHEAGDGLAGLDMYKKTQPDVTFMDLTMPVMDGAMALSEIIKYDKHALVIVLTADVQVKSLAKVTDLGAFLVVKKPPNKENIEDALSKAEEKLGLP